MGTSVTVSRPSSPILLWCSTTSFRSRPASCKRRVCCRTCLGTSAGSCTGKSSDHCYWGSCYWGSCCSGSCCWGSCCWGSCSEGIDCIHSYSHSCYSLLPPGGCLLLLLLPQLQPLLPPNSPNSLVLVSPSSACLLLLPQGLLLPPLRAPPKTAPPRSPAPTPRMPPSISSLPVLMNLVSVEGWLPELLEGELLEDEDDDPPNFN